MLHQTEDIGVESEEKHKQYPQYHYDVAEIFLCVRIVIYTIYSMLVVKMVLIWMEEVQERN